MEFVFYNEITGEEKIIFADDQECAEIELQEEVEDPDLWRISRPWEDRPGFDYAYPED